MDFGDMKRYTGVHRVRNQVRPEVELGEYAIFTFRTVRTDPLEYLPHNERSEDAVWVSSMRFGELACSVYLSLDGYIPAVATNTTLHVASISDPPSSGRAPSPFRAL